MINVYLQQAAVAFNAGDFPRAEQQLRQVLDLVPEHANAHFMLGAIAGRQGQYDRAADAFERALRANPDNPACLSNLALACQAGGRLERAREIYLRVIAVNHADPVPLNNLAVIYCELGRPDAALDCCDRALALRPDYAGAWYNRGNALRDRGSFTQAIESYRRSIELAPDNPAVFHNCGEVLWKTGQTAAAEECVRTALELNPDLPRAHSNLLFLLAARGRLPHSRMLEEQQAWDARHGAEGRAHPLSDGVVRIENGRRVRVGYLSPDFRTHAVSSFFEPLFAAHDRGRFETFCYATHPPALSDAVTQRLRDLADHWRDVHALDDAGLAGMIHGDGVDILVDLSGHTSDNRLGVFTRKPAPVQVTYLGGFAATGLQAMDYWMTDAVLHPADTRERAVETIVRLPRCWVSYQPPAAAPDVAACPNRDEQVVFGSFSNLSKLVPEVLAAWSRILAALPGSRLLVMDVPLGDPGVREQWQARLEQAGIARERLILQGGMPYTEYLGMYAQVDIVLDPFPRTGGATSAEAIWMGVPLVTLAGDRYAGRISASQLTGTGLQELIAGSVDEYVGKAVALARDPGRREVLRVSLRGRMRESEFCDGTSLARAVEQAYLRMCGLQ